MNIGNSSVKMKTEIDPEYFNNMGWNQLGSGYTEYVFVYPHTKQYGFFKNVKEFNKSGLEELKNEA